MKTSDQTRVPGYLNENDRAIIKEFCKLNRHPLQAVVDLNKNLCTLYAVENGNKLEMGTIQKVVFKNTFVLLNTFNYYPNRNPLVGTKRKVIYLPPGTEITVCDYDKNKLWIPIEDEWVLIDRYIIMKSANVRQKFELYLSNPQEGIGIGEGQKRIELLKMINISKSSKFLNLCTI